MSTPISPNTAFLKVSSSWTLTFYHTCPASLHQIAQYLCSYTASRPMRKKSHSHMYCCFCGFMAIDSPQKPFAHPPACSSLYPPQELFSFTTSSESLISLPPHSPLVEDLLLLFRESRSQQEGKFQLPHHFLKEIYSSFPYAFNR